VNSSAHKNKSINSTLIKSKINAYGYEKGRDVPPTKSEVHSRSHSIVKIDEQSNIELSEFLKLENDCV
jgi:hypothetical protein